MYFKSDWNGIKAIKTHQSSRIVSGSYAEHIKRIAARIARDKFMYRDEYLTLCERIAGRLVSWQGLPSTMRSIKADTGYGRIIGGNWEVSQWEVSELHEGAYYCNVEALTAPWLDGYVCFRCKCALSKKHYGIIIYCDACRVDEEMRFKTLSRIYRDESEAKELRSLTRKLERCIREKVKTTAPVPH